MKELLKELRCPNCGSVFHVDKDMFASLANQVRDKAFDDELKRRACDLQEKLKSDFELQRAKDEQHFARQLSERDLSLDRRTAEINMLKEKVASVADKTRLDMADTIARRDEEIARLRQQLASAEQSKKLEIEAERLRQQQQMQAKINDLTNTLETSRREAASQLASLKEKHSLIVSEKEKEIEYYKDFKMRMSTKLIGESLEIHCSTLFEQARSMGLFPDAQFSKDNDARTGSKGDFIFRDFIDGEEYISIMFEMKNEADTSATKHKNTDFLEKLNKDRNEKHCEFAVLVSMLERDNELYNAGIVNLSHRYPKMYVIRPQMFMPLIALLCHAAQKSSSQIRELRSELELARAQSLDVSKFEKRRNDFAAAFSKLVKDHNKKTEDATSGIDKIINSLEKQIAELRKVRDLFSTADKKLLQAEDLIENKFTIKKLTYGNPTMRAKFEEARKQNPDPGAEQNPDAGDE